MKILALVLAVMSATGANMNSTYEVNNGIYE
jgi:hypothetical protein